MMTICRCIIGAGMALAGVLLAIVALFKHGAWVALCALLVLEGLASLILPDVGRDDGD